MATLKEMRDRISELTPQRMEEEVLNSVQKNEDIATGMNTDQLFAGEDSQGKSLPNYSQNSVQVFGKPSGPMRLFDEGDFYRGFFVKADKFPISIFSHDNKTGRIADMLAAKGANPDAIYGLQKQNLKEFTRTYVLEDLQETVRRTMGV